MIDVRTALPQDLPAAVEVWHAANIARGLPPTPHRLARIREKLTAPAATVLVAVLPGAVDAATDAAVLVAVPPGAVDVATDAAVLLAVPPGALDAATAAAVLGAVPPGAFDAVPGPPATELVAPPSAPETSPTRPSPAPTGPTAATTEPAAVTSAHGAAVGVPDAAPTSPTAATIEPAAPTGGPGVVVGMALVEPGRTEDGAGEPVPGYGHVSMVFVHPSHWSNGYGRHLLRAVHALGWTRTTLWTRRSNDRAQRLYSAVGYTPTGRTAHLSDGDAIIQLERLAKP